MNNNSYQSLKNEANDGTSKRNKKSLKLRLGRVFSTSGIQSPNNSTPVSAKSFFSKQKTFFAFDNIDNGSPVSTHSSNFSQDSSTPSTNSENRMKYSPKQYQKERKSESEHAGDTAVTPTTTPSRSCSNQDNSRINDSRMISGMFAWIRVFRMATMLHRMAS